MFLHLSLPSSSDNGYKTASALPELDDSDESNVNPNDDKHDNNDDNNNDMESLCSVGDFFDDYLEFDSLSMENCSLVTEVPNTLTTDRKDNNMTKKNELQEKQEKMNHDPPPPGNMDDRGKRMGISLHDIPYAVTMKLMKSMDPDNGWNNLAAVSGLTFDDISDLTQQERQVNGSSTRCLLWKLGSLGYTAQMLYEKLLEINRKLDAETMATYIMEGDRRSRLNQSMMSNMSLQNSSNSSSGSEVNFNHPSKPGKSQMKDTGAKYYEDKNIPGPSQVSHTSYLKSPIDNTRQEPVEASDQSFASGLETSVLRQNLNMSQSNKSQLEAQVAMSVKTSFSYEELHTATEAFNLKNVLGEGGFGVVYYGHLRSMDCAVKRFIKTTNDKKTSTEQLNSELAALLRYQHENIVTLYGYALDGPELCLVYQYLSNGSLEDRLMKKGNTPALSWERRLNILVGSCRAISFLHTMGSQPLIHGDIKSANILLDKHLEAKFADLGQSRYATSRSSNTGVFTHITLAETTTRQYGTKAYQSPETSSGCSVSIQSDVFAMGVVILEICSGLKAYDYNRNANKFLTDFYKEYVSKLTDTDQAQIFQDRSPSDSLHLSVFLSLLKLASQCIKDIMKHRPSSTKLLKTAKEIYDNQYKKQPLAKNINSPIEDADVSDVSALSNYQSHFSEPAIANEVNSPLSQSVQPSFVRMQNERFQQISLQKQGQDQIPSSQNMSYPKGILPGKMSQLNSELHSTQTNKVYSQVPSMVSQPLPPHIPVPETNKPEAIFLQEHYDRLSGRLPSQQELSHNSNADEPNQGRKPPEEGEADFSISSDPEKLAAMNYFDKHGFTNVASTVKNDDPPDAYKCDEKKVAYLTKFDDQVFLTGSGNTNPKSSNVSGEKVKCTESMTSRKDFDDNTMRKMEVSPVCFEESVSNEKKESVSNEKKGHASKGRSDKGFCEVSSVGGNSYSNSSGVNVETGMSQEGTKVTGSSLFDKRENMFLAYQTMMASESFPEDGQEGNEEEDIRQVQGQDVFDHLNDGTSHKTTFL